MTRPAPPRLAAHALLALAAALAPACGGAETREPAAPAPHHGHAAHGHGGGMPDRFDDPEAWVRRFEGPERDAWQRPDEVVAFLVDRPDLVVADVGAGTGYFSTRFARAVPRGAVWALDIEPSMVTWLEARAAREGLANLRARTVAPDDPGLGALEPRPDLVFLCNTYHHVEDRVAYFRRVREALGPGARLAIVDFYRSSDRGPPAAHKVPAAAALDELTRAGWRLEGRYDALPDQYVLVLRAP